MADAVLLDDEVFPAVTLTWTDDQGNAAALPTSVAGSSADPATVTVVDNGDGSFAVSSVGPVSTADVQIDFVGTNADGTSVTVSALVAVVSSDAIGGSVVFGTATKR